MTWSVLQAQTQNQITDIGFNGSLFWTPGYSAASPGQLVTLFATPLGVPDAVATTIPLPTSLSGVSVLARVIGASDASDYPTSLPILRIDHIAPAQLPGGALCPAGPDSAFCSAAAITVQIPTERVCYESPASVSAGAHPCAAKPYVLLPPLVVLNVKANGITGPDLPMRVDLPNPHLLSSCDSIFGPQSSSTCHPLITHADGTVVSSDNPARIGEGLTLYAVGLNGLTPNVAPSGYPLKITIPRARRGA